LVLSTHDCDAVGDIGVWRAFCSAFLSSSSN
jgi:hypothetical protein